MITSLTKANNAGLGFSGCARCFMDFPSHVERAPLPTRSRCITAIKPVGGGGWGGDLSLLLQEVGLLALLDTRVPNRLQQFDKLEGAVPSTRLAASCVFCNEGIKVKTQKRNFTLCASSFSPSSIRDVRKVYRRKLYLRHFSFFFFFLPPLNDDRPLNFIPHGGGKDGVSVGAGQRPTALAVPILSSGKQEVVSQAFPL